jgi:riboflavin biosynthesis pyrimidine reductase
MEAEDYRAWAHERVRAMLADGPAQRLVAVMVTSVDARAALDGKSGGLSSEPDKALLKAWRAAADAVLVGARTLETERYGSLIADEDRDARVAAGRDPWPRLLTVSRRMDLDLDAVLSTDPALPLTIYTEAEPPVGLPGEDVQVVRLPAVGPAAVVADARERYGWDVIGCEGGPHLLTVALAEGVLTDLSLTLSPVVLGSGPPLIGGDDLPDAVPLRLAVAEAHAGSVFAHYRVH